MSASDGRQVGDAQPRRVPGQRRLVEPQPRREQADHALAAPARATPSVPAAPPSCTGERAREPSRSRASTTASSQPAALSPKVVGKGLLEQRPAGHHACRGARPASPAQAAATPSSSARIRPSARLATSIAAVSITSWLVAPRWTKPAASSSSFVPQRRDQGHHRVAAGAAVAGDRPRRRSPPASQAAAIAVAASPGIIPASASAPARARLGVQHRLQPGRFGGRPADGLGDEEPAEGVAGTTQTTKKAVSPSPWRRMSKRRPPVLGDARPASPARSASSIEREHGILGVGLGLVGKVDPRHQAIEQPAREDRDVDVRRLHAAVRGPARGPGLTVRNSKRPSASVAQRPKPVNPSSSGTSSRRSSGWA